MFVSNTKRYFGTQAKGKEGMLGASMLVDSFAVDSTKCLFVLDTNMRPLEEHDWEKLFDALAPHTKTLIRDAFERRVRSDHVLANLDVINPKRPRSRTSSVP